MEGLILKIAGKSVIWSGIEKFSVLGVQFGIGIYIARIIGADEFGMIAMLSIFMAIAQTFIDSGFSNALVQKQDRTEADYSTVFYFNLVVSVFFYLIFFFSAQAIANFYEEPRLVPIIKWVGLNMVFSSLSIVQRARLIAEHNFKLQANVSLMVVLISGTVGVIMAMNGYGVWALVVQSLVNNFLGSIFLWLKIKWMPLWCFSFESFKKLFDYGYKLLFSGLLHTLYINMYNLMIGKMYISSQLGYYNRAYTIGVFPSVTLSEVISRAFFPIQCEHQADSERSKELFDKFLKTMCFVIFPLMAGLMVLSKPLILLLLTESWLPMVELMQIICFALMVTPVLVVNNSILKVMGRTDLFLRSEIYKKLFAVMILAGTIWFGLKWICWGLVINGLIDGAISIYYAKKVVRTGFSAQFKLLAPIWYMTLLMMFVVYVVISLFDALWLELLLGILSGFAAYVAFGKLFKIKELDLFFSFMKPKKVV